MIGNVFYFDWEIELLAALQTHVPSAIIDFLAAVTEFGTAALALVIVSYCYFSIDKREGRRILFNLMFVQTLGASIKNLVCRRRPYMDSGRVKVLKVVEKGKDPMDILKQGYSFPSMHAAASVSAYGDMARTRKKTGWTVFAAVMIVLISLSRLVLGVHFPTDVLAGLLLGCLGIFLLPLIQKKIANDTLCYGLFCLIALLGCIFSRSEDYYSCLGTTLGIFIGTEIELRYIHFELPRNRFFGILRVLLAALVGFAIQNLLKIPFALLASSGSMAFLLLRCLRYILTAVGMTALAPVIFCFYEKLFVKKDTGSEGRKAI